MCTGRGASSANVLINMVELSRRRGRLAEARELCDRAIAIRQVVIKEYPKIVSYRSRMGECWLQIGPGEAGCGGHRRCDRRSASGAAGLRRLKASRELEDGDVRGRLPRDAFVGRWCERLRRATVRRAFGSGKGDGDPAQDRRPVATVPRELRNDSCLGCAARSARLPAPHAGRGLPGPGRSSAVTERVTLAR